MQMDLPEKVNTIITTLEQAGFEAYAVGGCVRDAILGREPDDWDITTSAQPLEVKRLFPRTVDTGIQHGTVTIMMGKEGFEVTTYRIDGEYEDGRHPKEVTFTPNLIEDLKRRDFTMNAMAYNHREGLIDAFGGMKDIEHKTIRCVGVAKERFTEDALRIMRAIRFSAQLGYRIDEETSQAIRELAPTLRKISAERIQVELVKLLISPHPDYIRLAMEMGVTRVFLPEFDRAYSVEQHNPHHQYTVGEHLLQTLLYTEQDKALRLAALLHDLGKAETRTTDQQGIDHFYGHADRSERMAKDICKRLKFDNDTITTVCKYVKYHDYSVEPTAKGVRRAIYKIGESYFAKLLELKYADMMAQSTFQREEKAHYLQDLDRIYHQVLAEQDCVSLKTLAVTGKDLIAAGIAPGKNLGEILRQMLLDVIDYPQHNTQEYLITHLQQFQSKT